MNRITVSLAALSLFASCYSAAFGQATSTTIAEDLRLVPYAQPGERVDIGGRHVNLTCFGKGVPTVVLMAGYGSWSPVWYKTQPEIAKRTRVCAFDRPGFGFSDPAPQPLILSDVPVDLHAALKAANLPAPYVLVGQSLGGLEARLFAQRWPREVAGMVMVDTGQTSNGLTSAELAGADEAQGAEKEAAHSLSCTFRAQRGPVDVASGCVPDYLQSDTPAAFRQAWPRFFTSDYWAAQVSLLPSLYTHHYDSADHLNLGDMPFVVLARDPAIDDGIAKKSKQAFDKWWFGGQEALSRLSTRGEYRIIKGAGHEIQLDKPQAVIDAVDEVLGRLRAK